MRVCLVAIAALLGACATERVQVIEAGEPVTAFVGVTVISRYGGARCERCTVAVRGDRIIAVAPDEALRLPEDATVIRPSGMLLAPGVADMHVHFQNPDAGPLFLANSVTTVRNPSGGGQAMQLANRIARGETPGPRMYMSGQVIDGPGSFWGPSVAVETAEQMRVRVRQDAAAGYCAIKLYDRLTPDLFRAGVEEARAHDLQIYAHIPSTMSLDEALALHVDSIEHLDEFDAALGGAGADLQTRWANAPGERFAPLARQVAESGVWQTPTLIVNLAPWRALADPGAAMAAPEMRYADSGLLNFWSGFAAAFAPPGADLRAYYGVVQAAHARRRDMLRALREAHAPLLIGTDAPSAHVMYGFSLHEEFGFYREAGFTNAEILRMATLDAARFLRVPGEFGVIEKGARADFVLLDADPEVDLSVLRRPAGVMAAGRWHDAASLKGLLETQAARATASRGAAH